jgi:hypothetical protein
MAEMYTPLFDEAPDIAPAVTFGVQIVETGIQIAKEALSPEPPHRSCDHERIRQQAQAAFDMEQMQWEDSFRLSQVRSVLEAFCTPDTTPGQPALSAPVPAGMETRTLEASDFAEQPMASYQTEMPTP